MAHLIDQLLLNIVFTFVNFDMPSNRPTILIQFGGKVYTTKTERIHQERLNISYDLFSNVIANSLIQSANSFYPSCKDSFEVFGEIDCEFHLTVRKNRPCSKLGSAPVDFSSGRTNKSQWMPDPVNIEGRICGTDNDQSQTVQWHYLCELNKYQYGWLVVSRPVSDLAEKAFREVL